MTIRTRTHIEQRRHRTTENIQVEAAQKQSQKFERGAERFYENLEISPLRN